MSSFSQIQVYILFCFHYLAAIYVAVMHRVVYSKLGNNICELLVGLKADIRCDDYIYSISCINEDSCYPKYSPMLYI